MSAMYTQIGNLVEQAAPPADGIFSRTLFDDDQVKTVIFGFGQGEELSEHTASMPAILQLIQGKATLTLGKDTVESEAGAWIHMPAELPHSIRATTPVVMLLLLLKKSTPAGDQP